TSIFFPWALLLIPAGVLLWRRRREWPAGMSAIMGWIVIPFLVLTIASGKRHAYLLPILPALALVTAWYCDVAFFDKPLNPALRRIFSVACIFFAIIGIVLSVWVLFRPDFIWHHEFYATLPEVAVWAIAALAFGMLGFLSLRLQSSWRFFAHVMVAA